MFKSLERTRRAARTSLSAFAILFVVTACQTTEEPAAARLVEVPEGGIEAAGFKADTSLRTRYLPPIGNRSQVVGEFVNGMPIEVAVFALAAGDAQAVGTALVTLLSSDNDELTVQGDTYHLAWPVFDPPSHERVRVEIRMVGSGPEPVCNVNEGECLGYLNVRIVERGGKGHGGGNGSGMITVPSGKSLNASFKILVASGLNEMATLSGQGGINPGAGSCPVDEVALPSQGLQAVGAGLQAVGAGLQAVGAAGGFFFAPVTELQGNLVTVSDLNDTLLAFDGELDDYPGEGSNATVLIVLDDFGGQFELPGELFSDPIDDIDFDDLGAPVTHGALVFHELRSLLDDLLGPGTPSPSAEPFYVDYFVEEEEYYYEEQPSLLRLMAADARDGDGIDTDRAAAALKAALTQAQAEGFSRAVVNMSFAIVPCAVLSDFVGADPPTFEEYVGALLAYNGVAGATAAMLATAVHQPAALDDALLNQLACPLVGEDTTCGGGFTSIVHVAASGNYGLDYPLYPAAAPGVVSVGSQPFRATAFVPGRSDFSNAAGIVAAGDLMLLRDDGTSALAYIGTSYSAPFVSLFVALDQHEGSQTCDAGDPGNPATNPPQLASGELLDLPLLQGLTSDSLGVSAVSQLCTD